MKCRQCNKPVSMLCKRTDCLAEVSLLAQQHAQARLARAEYNLNCARHNFRENFDKVAEWSESRGWTKPDHRGTNYRIASETDRGKLVIQAIARSL